MCVAFTALLGYVVMFLWNHVLTAVTNVRPVDYWQAVGILVLSKILFGGFRGKKWGRGGYQHWKNKWSEKWRDMSPEEREKIKQEWRNRCSMWRSQPDAESLK